MKKISLLSVLFLVGCGGPQFTSEAASKPSMLGNPEAGATSGGEGGEGSSAGLNSGGSVNPVAGTSAGGSSIAGSNDSGSNSGGQVTTAGMNAGGNAGNVSGGTAGASAGMNTGGNTAGSGGSGGSGSALTCKPSLNGYACQNVVYTWNNSSVPAEHAWECPETTDAPPEYVKEDNGKVVRQCTASSFGTPNNLWCCTS